MLTRAAAVTPPRICAITNKTARSGGMTRATARESAMAGLNRAPETRKKIHTLITRDDTKGKGDEQEIRSASQVLPLAAVGLADGRLAMLAAANPMNRNIVVPIYSPVCGIRKGNSIMKGLYHGDEFMLELFFFSHVESSLMTS